MTERSVVHDTIVIEQTFSAAPERVFQAWADARQRAQWHFPGDADWTLTEFDQDFRVGGHARASFGPRGRPNFREDGLFLDIVPNRRIVSAATVHRHDVRISATLCTVEMSSRGTGTRLKVTDHSAFLDGGEKPADRRAGWGAVFAKLSAYLEEPSR